MVETVNRPEDRSTVRHPLSERGRSSRARGTDQRRGASSSPGKDPDLLGPFAPAILAVRWATAMVSVTLAAGAFVDSNLTVVAWVAAVVCNTAVRTTTPLRDTGSTRSVIPLLLEVVLHVFALTATGYWESPLVFSLVTAVIVAGFARGFGFGIRIAAASGFAVSIPALESQNWTQEAFAAAGQWMVVLLLVGVVAGYGRRISGEANRQHSLAMDRLTRLADANALLFNLHRVAQTLPASLDMEEVLESTLSRLRGLLGHDAAAIFVVDEADGSWVVAKKSALPLGRDLRLSDLPPPVSKAIRTRRLVLASDLSVGGPGLRPASQSAIYAPLMARGNLIGLLAIEHRDPERFGERDREVMQSFVDPVALAIDNARWFARLRTVGADEERTRIARDLHDRIGQSLAYLGFELDRLARRQEQGEPLGNAIQDLRDDLGTVIGEVRDTLYDLRTDVDAEKDFAVTVEEFSARVAERSGIEIELDCDRGPRLPILQEREMWRIAQEALVNVERHAEATRASVTWRCDGTEAVLDVDDNGKGFPAGDAGRVDSYGIVGMRERASSIGATLELNSSPGEGTNVRCFLAQD